MALIVEDGTGVANANAYVSLTEATTYHLARNNQAWQGDSSILEAAIIKATDFIENRWSGQFKGLREHDDQVLSFPRTGIEIDGVAQSGIPVNLKRAVFIYALCSLSQELVNTPTVDASGFPVTKSVQQVGPIKTELEFQSALGATVTYKQFPEADVLMSHFLNGSSFGTERF